MVQSLLLIVLCITGISAQDISISKDSLWVYNSNFSSKADAVILTSNVAASINLDSTHIVIEEMDTIGFSQVLAEKRMEASWSGNSTNQPFYSWRMDSIGKSEYVLKKKEFIPWDATPPSFHAGNDSIQISRLSIGSCFVCAELPIYPRYIKGKLQLYFSNGQAIALRLYSDDLRTPVKMTMRPMNPTLRNFKIISNRNSFRVSWMPVSGALQFTLFDLKGRQLYQWECDGRKGFSKVTLKARKLAPSTNVLHIIYNDGQGTAQKDYIVLPR